MAKFYQASVIVPVFNEQGRIEPFLKELEKEIKNDWEIIFVDDGSKDKTADLIKKSGIKNLRIISYDINKGKGYAVKKGVEASTGKLVIFIDADDSIHPSQIDKMVRSLKEHDFVAGDRSAKESDVQQPLFRKFFGFCFNTYSNALFGLSINDKLCGFKGFRSSIAKKLFSNLKSNRWIFDIEIFFKAKKHGIKLHQIPINWIYKDKSKMKPLDLLKMIFELIILRMRLMRPK